MFRPPTSADAAPLAGLVEDLHLVEGDPTGNFTAETALHDVIAPGAPISALVAEEAGALIGFAFWHVAYESAYAMRGGYVSDFHVIAAKRGSGLAEQLLRAVARAVKAEGGAFIWLTAHRTNARARAFYRKHMTEEPDHVVLEFAAWDRFEALLK